MTITLTNVSYDFLSALKGLMSLDRSVRIYEENEPNETTLQTIKDTEEGKNLVGPFNGVEDVMKALNAED
ncbi:MAG: hypothetical protein ACTTJF_02625 [Campylobacter sp.]|uniref:hypothetical protein n=1 Tax=Campylobacter sp. TaxID=205 RepID=UPI003F9FB37D